jgi:hypothetical protein
MKKINLKSTQIEYNEFSRRPEASYPHAIQSLLRKFKANINPWANGSDFNAHEYALMLFFRFRQAGVEEICLVGNPTTAWVELNFFGEAWICNPYAMKDPNLGEVIFPKTEIYIKQYALLSIKHENPVDFYEYFGTRMRFNLEEYVIEAQEDESFAKSLRIRYTDSIKQQTAFL